jgi:hypothetical protein
MRTQTIAGQRIRRVAAVAVASTFLTQNFAWAVCSDGTTFPAGNQGFLLANLETVAPSLANMSPDMFTSTAGSVFVPDNSSFENKLGRWTEHHCGERQRHRGIARRRGRWA